jgi:hypothetical protein
VPLNCGKAADCSSVEWGLFFPLTTHLPPEYPKTGTVQVREWEAAGSGKLERFGAYSNLYLGARQIRSSEERANGREDDDCTLGYSDS